MKYLKVLTLIFIFGIFSLVFAQEKTAPQTESTERLTEMCNEIELAKPTTISENKQSDKTKTSDPHGFIFQSWTRRNRPQIPNIPAEITNITLSKTEIFLKTQNNELNTTRTIDILTEATDPENDFLNYNYTISGGRIIGEGKKVTWDLSNVKVGSYTITAAVDDGCGFCGRTVTKTIVVKECRDCQPR